MLNRILKPEVAWPAAVILLLCVGIGSALAVLLFSRADGGAEVLSDYYRKGLAWDSTAQVRSAAGRFGWTIDLVPADSTDGSGMRAVRIEITDSTDHPVADLVIDVEVSRPHLAAPVGHATAMAHVQPGTYVAWLPVREIGVWDFEVRGRNGPTPFTARFRREILR